MDAQELLEQDADFSQTGKCRGVLFEQIATSDSQMRLCYGRRWAIGIFWSVEATTEAAKDTSDSAKVHAEWVLWHHRRRLERTAIPDGVTRVWLAIVEGDIDWQPMGLTVVFNLVFQVLILIRLGFDLFTLSNILTIS